MGDGVKYVSNLPRLIAAKEVRDNVRYTQNEIADGVGISRATVSKLLNEKTSVLDLRYRTAQSLAQWLDCSMDDLVIREDELRHGSNSVQ